MNSCLTTIVHSTCQDPKHYLLESPELKDICCKSAYLIGGKDLLCGGGERWEGGGNDRIISRKRCGLVLIVF